MKKLLSILSLAILIFSCSETKERISSLDVEKVNGRLYLTEGRSLVTGTVTAYYSNGQLESEINYKDGKRDGLYKRWYQNGQLQAESNFKDGKEDGILKVWYETTTWFPNLQLYYTISYKDGEKNGVDKRWEKNGQVRYERNYKDVK